MAFSYAFHDVHQFRFCEQCGSCSSACPLTGVDDFNIRRILRHVELGLVDEIASTAQAWRCTTCARCETACPNGIAILDVIRPLRALAPEELTPLGPPPCTAACPGKIDIPGYLRLIAAGEPAKAYELILESVPFPGILGRVCTRPCEAQCIRAEVNQPIAICALKRYASDMTTEPSAAAFSPAESSGKQVAVIGSGPAGLTAAFYLRKKGHGVTVFEARPLAGGMLRYGIPRYRLPEEVLDQEIERVLSSGIELQTDQRLGFEFDLESLRSRGFGALFLATGLQRSKRIDIEDAQEASLLWGIEFLSAISAGEKLDVKKRVVVIGGGDVAVDVAMTVQRLGAETVTLICLESREELPAHHWEIEQALEDGIELKTGWGPRRVLYTDGQIAGIELRRCVAAFDAEGNFSPTFSDELRSEPADQVILAIGQAADLSFTGDSTPLNIDRDLVAVEAASGKTNIEGIFAGGEITTGPGSLIEAIAEGKKVATAIDRFLGGNGLIERVRSEPVVPLAYAGKREKGFADLIRREPPVLPVGERRCNFAEVERCMAQADAEQEAQRCLNCDLELHPERILNEQKPT